MNRIKELPKCSSHLLTSTQIVTSVYGVIKELIENSIDSCAKNIEIKLEDYGLEKIEVRDNGSGIHKDDMCSVAKPHCTSKITSHLDLDKVETYGFRGEALAALCAVSDLNISTKTDDDDFGFTYTFNHKGEVLSSKPCPLNKGTIITALNLFKNVPVRKQLYRNNKVRKEELKKVENLLIAFGCIQEGLRISLYHDQNLIWQKLSARSTPESLQQVFGNCIFEHMENYNYSDDETQISIELFLPKNNAPKICSQSTPSRTIVAVNKRPVRMKLLDKLIKEHYNKTLESGNKSCYPICYVSITVPPSEVDVNFEPNKTAVAMQNNDLVIQHLSEVLNRFYSKGINIETGSDVSNSTFQETNNKVNFCKLNQKDIPTVQTKQPHIEPSVLSEIENDSVREVNMESMISTQKSQFLKGIQNISTREIQVTSGKLSRKNSLTTPSCKRVKTSSSVSHPSKSLDIHIQTLDSFLSSTENDKTFQATTESIANVTPVAITVQRRDSSSNITMESIHNNAEPAVQKDINFHPFDTSTRKRHSSDPSVSIISHSTDVNPSISRASIGINEWSRGIHPTENSFIPPVTILKPKANETDNNSNKNIRLIESLERKGESGGGFQNQRKITAFDVFCRKNRLEVASLNPTLSNQQIAQNLTEKWNQLPPEEKEIYKNMITENFPKHMEKEDLHGTSNTNLEKAKITPVKSKKTRKMKHKYLEKKILFNIEMMKNTLCSRPNLESLVDGIKVINSVSSGIWLCLKENKLYLLNSFRLQEIVVYHRLLETFQLEADPLDSPFIVPTSSFDSDDMNIILQLDHTKDQGNEIRISDEKLTANGFELKLLKDENEIYVQAVGITKAVACYGIPELKQILSLIKAYGISAKLSDCRPSKVALYLQGEAVRIAKMYPASKRLEDIEDMLRQQKLLSDVCIHSKPFLHVLCSLSTDHVL